MLLKQISLEPHRHPFPWQPGNEYSLVAADNGGGDVGKSSNGRHATFIIRGACCATSCNTCGARTRHSAPARPLAAPPLNLSILQSRSLLRALALRFHLLRSLRPLHLCCLTSADLAHVSARAGQSRRGAALFVSSVARGEGSNPRVPTRALTQTKQRMFYSPPAFPPCALRWWRRPACLLRCWVWCRWDPDFHAVPGHQC